MRMDCINPLKGHPPRIIPGLHWIGSTGLAVGGSSCCQADSLREVVVCGLDVCSSACSTSRNWENSYLHLPVVGSKFDRHSLQNHLPETVEFSRKKLANGLSLLICCPDGEDISVCVCLAILLSCFDFMVMGRRNDGLSGLEYRQQRKPPLRRLRYESSSMFVKGRAPVTAMVGVVALMWALCWLDVVHSADMDSDLVETETGWQFADDDMVDAFDAPAPAPATAPAAAPAAKPKGGVIPLIDGDFEQCTAPTTGPTLVDNTTTLLPNWVPNGAGVTINPGALYGGAKAGNKFCVMLNNPGQATTINGTQGSLSTTLAANPATGKTYTVHYDVARAPDGPINLVAAIKVSAMQGATTHDWVIHWVPYNVTDTMGHSTWVKQSLVYTGTGAQTVIKFESMSEKYGPMIDNVETLTGSHPLAGAPLGKVAGLCQRALPVLSLLTLAAVSHIL